MAVTQIGNTYYGDDENDTIEGTDANEIMYGYHGNDTLKGAGGNDFLQGGMGNDKIFGGEGNDTLVDWGDSVGAVGNELIGKDELSGGKGNDVLTFLSADTGDIANGGDGKDRIVIDYRSTTFSSNVSILFTLLSGGSSVLVDEANSLFVQACEALNYFGSSNVDVITGGAMNDTIYGYGGNDTLSGLDGNDWLDGGSGQQNTDGGDGFDTVSFDLGGTSESLTVEILKTLQLGTFGTVKNFEAFGEVYTGWGSDTVRNGDSGGIFHTGGGGDQFTGGTGRDIWYMGTGADSGTLGKGNDQALVEDGQHFDTGIKNVRGGDGNDAIVGAAGADTLFGDAGNDNLYGGKGTDTIEGGTGNDTIEGGAGADSLEGGDGNDYLEADRDQTGFNTVLTYDTDRLNGGDGDDTLQGGFGADILNGQAGNDTVELSFWDGTSSPDASKDTADGGSGNDTLAMSIFSTLDWDLDLTLSANIALTVEGVRIADALRFEALRINASGSGEKTIVGGDLDDSMWTGSGDDVLTGKDGNDFLYADTGSDTVMGGGGNDRIDVKIDSDDVVDAGGGKDLVIVRKLFAGQTAGMSVYDAGAGIDTLSLEAGTSDMRIDGDEIKIDGVTVATALNWEILNFYGSSLGSTIVGTDRNDVFTLLQAADDIKGGKGDDTFVDYGGTNMFDGGQGRDTVNYSNTSVAIVLTLKNSEQAFVTEGGVKDDRIRGIENVQGSQAADRITGDDLDNTLDGSLGNDILKGMGGDDRLISGVGADTLTGGAGADTFVYLGAYGSSPATYWQIDTITDFTHGTDRFDFSDFDANSQKAGVDPFIFLVGEGKKFSGVAGQLRFDQRAGDTFVEGDTNGDGIADLVIRIDDKVSLDRGDFML